MQAESGACLPRWCETAENRPAMRDAVREANGA